jgi:hypothetical protein
MMQTASMVGAEAAGREVLTWNSLAAKFESHFSAVRRAMRVSANCGFDDHNDKHEARASEQKCLNSAHSLALRACINLFAERLVTTVAIKLPTTVFRTALKRGLCVMRTLRQMPATNYGATQCAAPRSEDFWDE